MCRCRGQPQFHTANQGLPQTFHASLTKTGVGHAKTNSHSQDNPPNGTTSKSPSNKGSRTWQMTNVRVTILDQGAPFQHISTMICCISLGSRLVCRCEGAFELLLYWMPVLLLGSQFCKLSKRSPWFLDFVVLGCAWCWDRSASALSVACMASTAVTKFNAFWRLVPYQEECEFHN